MPPKTPGSKGPAITDGVFLLPKLASKTAIPNKKSNQDSPSKVRKSLAKKPSKAVSAETLAYPWLKNYPSNVKWDMKITPKPMHMLLEDTASVVPDSPCLNFMGKRLTYAEVLDLVNRTAKGLQSLGVKRGTRVGIFMPNAPYFLIAYYAILKAGGVVVNYNPLYADDDLIYQINNSETEMMFTLDLALLFDKLINLWDKTSLKKVIVCSVGAALPFPKNWLFPIFKHKDIAKLPNDERITYFSEMVVNDGDVAAIKIDPRKDLAVLQYTGGTTGVPKGAMLTHANIYVNAMQAGAWFPEYNHGEERILAALPLFHVFAMTVVMNLAIRTGAEIVLMFPRFEVNEAMKLLAKHKITFFPAVPTIYNLISHHPDVKKYDLSSIRVCLSGGAPLPLQVKEDFEALTGCKLVEGYGLSETSPTVNCNPPFGKHKEGSIGVPLPQTIVKIVSLEDPLKDLPLGEIGQVAIKGPQVMKGYWQQPIETANAFAGEFFLTGDMGYMDDEGYVFLVDRLKDMIICSGFNVYPRHVEEAIYKHPHVEEVTVIGVPDLKRGESVKAFVKVKQGLSLSSDELLNFLGSKLSPIEMPKEIEFRDELPKTMIGKLSKKELKLEEKSKIR